MAHCVGAQGQVQMAKMLRTLAPITTSPTENHKPKTKELFSIWTRRLAESVDALNSSLAQSAGKLWSCKKLQTWVKKAARPGLKGFNEKNKLIAT